MEFRYQTHNGIAAVRVEREGTLYRVTVGERAYTVSVHSSEGDSLAFTINGSAHRAYSAADPQEPTRRYVAFNADVITLTKAETTSRRKTGTSGESTLSAAMPGQVVKVLVNEGDLVGRGQTLILLEAMKMEIRITAPTEGRVSRIRCEVGQIVERGQRLLELAAE